MGSQEETTWKLEIVGVNLIQHDYQEGMSMVKGGRMRFQHI